MGINLRDIRMDIDDGTMSEGSEQQHQHQQPQEQLHKNNGQKNKEERKKQLELESILDAALDELDEDDSENDDHEDEDDNEDDNNPKCNRIEPKIKSTRPIFGPEPPPPLPRGSKGKLSKTEKGQNDDNDDDEVELEKSLEGMMKTLLEAGERFQNANASDCADDDLAGRTEKALEEILQKMESQMENDADNHNHNNDDAGDKDGGSNDDEDAVTHQTPLPSKTSNTNSNSTSNGTANIDKTVAKLLREMSKAASDDATNTSTLQQQPPLDPLQFEQMGEDIMNDLMKQFQSMASPPPSSSDNTNTNTKDANANGNNHENNMSAAEEVMDGMMKQLLSKEILYEPMKQITEVYPSWLAKHKPTLSADDYQRYGTQYQYFQRIVRVYETDPDNVDRLAELMQEIQEYGQPPAEIVKELAPDLEFGEDGLPRMDVGDGVSGLPFPTGNEECVIM